MDLNLDDDCAKPVLVRLLQNAGHDVRTPAAVGRAGGHDAVHLQHAIRENRDFLRANRKDFPHLRDLIIEAKGHHPGILLVRYDNDPNRDLDFGGIVRAISKLIRAGVPIADTLIILNHWR
jgi:hypothetical protein